MSAAAAPGDDPDRFIENLRERMDGFETFLRVKKGLSPKTVSQHVTMARAFLKDVDTLCPTDEDVMSVREEMMEQDYSNSHINNTQNAIEYYFEHTGRQEALDDYSSLPRHTGNPNPFTNDELELFVKSATTIRDEALILFLSSSGVRASGAANLQFRDISIDGKTAFIRKAKNYNEYTAIFSEDCAKVLRRYRNIRDAEPEDPVFESRTGDSLTRNGLLQAIKRIADRAGIADAHTHRFRASFANRLRRNGADIYRIKELMGHRDLRSTVRYLTMDDDELREEHEKLLDSTRSNSNN